MNEEKVAHFEQERQRVIPFPAVEPDKIPVAAIAASIEFLIQREPVRLHRFRRVLLTELKRACEVDDEVRDAARKV